MCAGMSIDSDIAEYNIIHAGLELSVAILAQGIIPLFLARFDLSMVSVIHRGGCSHG